MNKLTKTMLVVLIATVAIFAQISNNGLVAWFPFTGNYNNESNSGLILDTVLSPILTADRNGVANAAYEFDGYTKAFKIKNAMGLPSGSSDFTITAWIFSKNGGMPRVIASWGTDTINQKKEVVFYKASIDGFPYLGITNGVDSIVAECPTNSLNTWFFAAVKISSGSATFYMNGTPTASQSISFNIQNGGDLGIGLDMTGLYDGINYFGGYIDDISIYNRALTDQEITYIKNSPSTNNKAPTITSTAVTTAKVLEQYNYTITTSDPENHTITVAVPVKPSGMNLSNNKLIWTPTVSQSGNHTVTIIAKDEMGDSSVQTFVIKTEGLDNQAPTITSTPVTSVTIPNQFSYQVVASDPEGQTVTIILPVKPYGMNLTFDMITWAPTEEQAGNHTVSVVAKDEMGDTSIQTFTVMVIVPEKNTAPTFVSSAPVNAKTSKEYVYDIEVNDAENDAVTLYLLNNPTNMELNGTQITWTPKSDQTGNYPVVIVAKDAKGDSSKQSFEINVEPSTSVVSKIVPNRINFNNPTQKFYLPNGRLCRGNVKNLSGLILNKDMKRLMIR